MSWDKNTVNKSTILALHDGLFRAGNHEVELQLIGKVAGRGIGDVCFCYDKECSCGVNPFYPIYRMQVGDTVYIDQYQMYSDCDADDFIVTLTMTPEEEANYVQEVLYHDEDSCPTNECDGHNKCKNWSQWIDYEKVLMARRKGMGNKW